MKLDDFTFNMIQRHFKEHSFIEIVSYDTVGIYFYVQSDVDFGLDELYLDLIDYEDIHDLMNDFENKYWKRRQKNIEDLI